MVAHGRSDIHPRISSREGFDMIPLAYCLRQLVRPAPGHSTWTQQLLELRASSHTPVPRASGRMTIVGSNHHRSPSSRRGAVRCLGLRAELTSSASLPRFFTLIGKLHIAPPEKREQTLVRCARADRLLVPTPIPLPSRHPAKRPLIRARSPCRRATLRV